MNEPVSDKEFARALVRFNAHVMGATLAVIFGSGLLAATLFLAIKGGPHPGQMLELLRYFFPGYHVSVGGSFVGGFWGLLSGYVVGLVLGYAYGKFFQRTVSVLLATGKFELFGGLLSFRAIPFGLITGGLLAAGLFVSTNWLSLRGYPSPTLNLLHYYLPGFRSNFVGSLIGSVWIFLYGLGFAGSIAWVYNKVVAFRR